jgi:hypothetical protein
MSSSVRSRLREGLSVNILGFQLGQLLPSLDCCVDVTPVDFNGVAASAGALTLQSSTKASHF